MRQRAVRPLTSRRVESVIEHPGIAPKMTKVGVGDEVTVFVAYLIGLFPLFNKFASAHGSFTELEHRR